MYLDKILIIEQSFLLRNYLKEKLSQYGFEVIVANNAYEGLIKIKNNIPDIIIIDYNLTLDERANFFEEKKKYKPIANIPVIVCASKVDSDAVIKVAKYNIAKFFIKPLKIDLLLNTISEIINKEINFDNTICMVDVNLNDDILFIEIASGLNIDKIELINFKIKELKKIHNAKNPKVLLILTDIELNNSDDIVKFNKLLTNIIKYGNPNYKAIKILTNSQNIKNIIAENNEFNKIEVTNDINYAIEKLSDLKIDELIFKNIEIDKPLSDDVLLWSNEIIQKEDKIEDITNSNIKISIVDDDEYIRLFLEALLYTYNFQVKSYPDGYDFIKDVTNNIPDLLFLDIMMPKMSGLEVLDNLKKLNLSFPIIIFSTVNQRDIVLKAKSYGIKSYIVKPVSNEVIINKINEVFNSNF